MVDWKNVWGLIITDLEAVQWRVDPAWFDFHAVTRKGSLSSQGERYTDVDSNSHEIMIEQNKFVEQYYSIRFFLIHSISNKNSK